MNRCTALVAVLGMACTESTDVDVPALDNTAPYVSAVVDARSPSVVPQPDATPIRYRLSFEGRAQHRMHVEVDIPTDGAESVELMMPVWTPGSYLVRDYARHIETIDAGPNIIEKTRKNRWRVTSDGQAQVTVKYVLYARQMSVRSNWVDADFAMLNGASTFLTRIDALGRRHEVRIDMPRGWQQSHTGLDRLGSAQHSYAGATFDILVDCPIVLGNPAVYPFDAGGKPHLLVNVMEQGIWDGPKSARDVRTLTGAVIDFWGVVPYERYLYLNVISGRWGGLEHLNSTLMLADPWTTGKREDYLDWLGLVSHEFFHTWNVKRMRPLTLGPFDYENENYTRSLWIAEGLTSYYDDLLLKRAGLMSRKEYLKKLSRNIERLQTTPGRLVHPLEMSSYDTWIKFYKADESFKNTSISYYIKGSVVGFLLDARIREATVGDKSLDDVMRTVYERFSAETGYTPDDFRAVAEELASTELTPFFETALERAVELDYASALAFYGLQFEDPDAKEDAKEETDDGDDDEDEPEDPKRGFFGIETKTEGQRLLVRRVLSDTPAYAAGLNVDDELLAIDDHRITADGFEGRLDHYPPGTRVDLLISRRGKLRRLPVELGEKPKELWTVEVVEEPTAEQKARLAAWLGDPPPPPAADEKDADERDADEKDADEGGADEKDGDENDADAPTEDAADP